MVFADAWSAIMTVFCIAFLGFMLKRKGWVTDETAAVIPKFLTNIALPPYLLRNITSTFSHDELMILLSGAVVPFLSLFACFAISAFLARLCKVREERRGVFMIAFVTSNTMNIGLPINIALFGDGAVQHVLLYFFASICFFWTVGNYCIAHDGNGKHVKIFSLESLKKVFSPPLMGFMVSLLLVYLDLRLPEPIDKTFKYIGDMVIALAVIYLGIMLHDTRIADFRLDKDTVLVLMGRFLISPLVIIALSWVWPIPDLMRKVFIIQASLPAMVNMAILAAYYKADAKFATVVVSVSTLMAVVTVPLITVLLSYFPE